MANEFVAKNGLISQNNTTVSGSLTVTQGITGSLFGTASNIQGGSSTYIPLWDANTRLTSSYLNQASNVLKTIYGGDSGLYLDFQNRFYQLGINFQNQTKLIVDDSNNFVKTQYSGVDDGLNLQFNSTYAFGNLPGNQKITISASSEIISIADQAQVGIKIEGSDARTITVGDVWGNAGTNTKVVVDATNNVVQVTGSFSVQNGAEFLGQVILTLGNYGDDTEAAANGVPVNGLYRNGNVVSIRIT